MMMDEKVTAGGLLLFVVVVVGGGGGCRYCREAFIVIFKIEPVRILISWCRGNR